MAIIYGKNTAVDYAPGNLASFGKSYSRMGAAPLDMTEVWYDKTALEEYASYLGTLNDDGSYDTSSVVSYVGQRVVYVDEEKGIVYNYAIQLDGSLKEIGQDVLGVEALRATDDGKYPQVKWVEDDNGGHAEIVWTTITIPEQTDYTVTVSTDNVEGTNLKHYIFTQCGNEIAHIDIPKDLVVSSGEVVVATNSDKALDANVVVGDTYIKLIVANQTKPLYIAAKSLVDIYTVADTNTVDMTITGTEIKADVKVSKEDGNAVTVKNDGIYVDTPVIPEIPDVEVKTATKETAPTTDVAEVIASLVANGHEITPSVIEVVTKAGLDKITAGGKRFITEEEISKLAQLTLEEDGGVAISGTINAQNVHGLGTEVVDIVTGTGDYVSTPGVGQEGDEGYVAPTIIQKLGVEKGAQVNKIESVALPDAVLAITNKQVNLPAFTEGKYGVIKGAAANTVNTVIAQADGTGKIEKVSTDILVNGDKELVLCGGCAVGYPSV